MYVNGKNQYLLPVSIAIVTLLKKKKKEKTKISTLFNNKNTHNFSKRALLCTTISPIDFFFFAKINFPWFSAPLSLPLIVENALGINYKKKEGEHSVYVCLGSVSQYICR